AAAAPRSGRRSSSRRAWSWGRATSTRCASSPTGTSHPRTSTLRSPPSPASGEGNDRVGARGATMTERPAAPAAPAGGRLLADLAGLSPAYFGMVMATGIVSVAADLMGLPGIARGLFALNIVAYGALWALTAL